MRTVRVPAVVLSVALTIGSFLHAQTAPNTLPAGDAIRGKAIFESSKGNCLSCHRVNGTGSLFGPDLSAVAAPPRGGGGGARAGTPPPLPAPVPATTGANPGANPGNGATPQGPQLMLQSILDPNAVVSVQNRYVRLTMKDGKSIWGKLLSVDTFSFQIFDSNEKLQNVPKSNVRESTMASPMPSYRDKLTSQEQADVVEYLMSLKGQ